MREREEKKSEAKKCDLQSRLLSIVSTSNAVKTTYLDLKNRCVGLSNASTVRLGNNSLFNSKNHIKTASSS